MDKATEKENKMDKATEFLQYIVEGLKDSKDYAEAFKNNRLFTEFISKLIDEIAEKKKLNHKREYYSLDHVLYDSKDVIRELPYKTSRVNGLWLNRLRVAFEHENSLDAGGGYQEFAKLMLFNADVKVLMGYANRGENYDEYAKDYQWLYESISNKSSAELTPILFIGEYNDSNTGKIDAYLITGSGLLKRKDGAWISIEC